MSNASGRILVVGQGVAGTLLSHYLEEHAFDHHVVNVELSGSASIVSGGVMNPITGRRLVKTWLYEKLFPVAKEAYLKLGNKTGQKFYHELPMLKFLSDGAQLKNWEEKNQSEEIVQYVKNNKLIQADKAVFVSPFGAYENTSSAYINMKLLLESYKAYLNRKGKYFSETFDFKELKRDGNLFTWRSKEYQKVIFCEGYRVKDNPYFNKLDFAPVKGEIITFKSNHIPEDYIINKSIYVIPFGNGVFKAGSTYQHRFADENISESGKQELLRKLKDIVKVPIEIIEHEAGIRPATRMRRPVVCEHPEESGLYAFNGLGSKGVSLAPFFAKQMLDLICNKSLYSEDVSWKKHINSALRSLQY